MKKFIISITLSLFALSAFARAPETSLAPMLKKVLPAVVNISVEGQLPAPNWPFLKQHRNANLPAMEGPKFRDVGSGVIINAKKGLIVTNAHVIHDAKIITVSLSDGRRLKGEVVGRDAASDIAVIKVHADNLTALTLTNSNRVEVGDFVAAIGNPFGLHQTVTSGVVSALHRGGDLGIERYEDFIQTDAPINPGNSGGALVNMRGQFVGMNTAIITPMGSSIGIGFAIPSNMVKRAVDQLVKYGKITRGQMGVTVQNLTPNLADALDMPKAHGALVTSVLPHSSAKKAGIKSKDIIEKINDDNLYSASQLSSIVGLTRAGQKLKLTVRRGNKLFTTEVAPEKIDAVQPHKARLTDFLSSVQLKPFDELIPHIGHVLGVQVVKIDVMSQAWLSGLRRDDIILAANNDRVTDIDQLGRAMMESHKRLLLKVQHMGPMGGTVWVVID